MSKIKETEVSESKNKHLIEDTFDWTGWGNYDRSKRGVTYQLIPNEAFAGDMITGSNRRDFIKRYFVEFLSKMIEDGELDKDEPLSDDVKARALNSSLERVRMNKKAHKAYLKGDSYFKYRGNRMLVPTIDRVELMKARVASFVDKYSQEDRDTLNDEEE